MPPMFWTPTQQQFCAELLFFRVLDREPIFTRISAEQAAGIQAKVVPIVRTFLSDLNTFDERYCVRYVVACMKAAMRGRE